MKGEMTLGALVAFVEYTRNCTWPMEMLGWLTGICRGKAGPVYQRGGGRGI